MIDSVDIRCEIDKHNVCKSTAHMFKQILSVKLRIVTGMKEHYDTFLINTKTERPFNFSA